MDEVRKHAGAESAHDLRMIATETSHGDVQRGFGKSNQSENSAFTRASALYDVETRSRRLDYYQLIGQEESHE